MMPWRVVLGVFALSAFAPVSALAQPDLPQSTRRDSILTRRGVCRLWEIPPVNAKFPEDASYNTCALHAKPTVITRTGLPYTTAAGIWMHAQFIVVVEPNGRVNDRLTRFHINDSPPGFLETIRDSLVHWRFLPGTRNGKAVRSALLINLTTIGMAEAGYPYKLEWRYRATEPEDTLTATWLGDDALPVLNQALTDDVYFSLVQTLVAKGVVTPFLRGDMWSPMASESMAVMLRPSEHYCLVLENGDSAAHGRITRRLLVAYPQRAPQYGVDSKMTYPLAFGNFGCERASGAQRIFLPLLEPQRGAEVSMNPSGDFLPHYPAGPDGRSWSSWMARCHVRTYESEVKSMNCDVQPKDVNEEYSRWSFARHAEFMLARRAETSGRSLGSDSAWITAIAFTGNALQSDTLRVTVASIPSYRKQTLSDAVAPCGKTVAFTQDTGTVYVAQGPANGSALTITKALRQTPHSVRDNGSCTASLQNRSASVAFLLGGIGATATKPVTLRYTGADKGSVLDPRKHMLALQPHLKFRIADLKLGSRAGGQLTLRIRVDAARPTDVVPMVVSYTNKAIWQNEAQFPVLVALRTWDFRITDYVGTDTWIYLYLVRRN